MKKCKLLFLNLLILFKNLNRITNFSEIISNLEQDQVNLKNENSKLIENN